MSEPTSKPTRSDFFLTELDGMIESTEEFIRDDNLIDDIYSDDEGRLADLVALVRVRKLYMDAFQAVQADPAACPHGRAVPRVEMAPGSSAWDPEPSMRILGYDCRDCGAFVPLAEWEQRTEEVTADAVLMGQGRRPEVGSESPGGAAASRPPGASTGVSLRLERWQMLELIPYTEAVILRPPRRPDNLIRRGFLEPVPGGGTRITPLGREAFRFAVIELVEGRL